MQILINASSYTADSDSFNYVTTVPPSKVPKSEFPFLTALIMAVCGAVGLIAVLLVSLLICNYYCNNRHTKKSTNKVCPVNINLVSG